MQSMGFLFATKPHAQLCLQAGKLLKDRGGYKYYGFCRMLIGLSS